MAMRMSHGTGVIAAPPDEALQPDVSTCHAPSGARQVATQLRLMLVGAFL